MRRVFPVLCALVIFFSCTPLSVSAATNLYPVVDWVDVAEPYYVDEENNLTLLSINFPLPSTFMYIREGNTAMAKSTPGSNTPKLNYVFFPGRNYSIDFVFQNLWTHDLYNAFDIELRPKFRLTGINFPTEYNSSTNLTKAPTIYFMSSYNTYEDGKYVYSGYDYNFTGDNNGYFGVSKPDYKVSCVGLLFDEYDTVTFSCRMRNFQVKTTVSATVELLGFEAYLRVPTDFYQKWLQPGRDELQDKNNLLLQNQEILLNNMIEEQQTTNEKMDDVIGGTPEQNEQISGALDGMEDSTDKLDQMGDTLNSVEKPAVEDMNVGITDLVPETSLLAYTSPILALWENKTLLAFLIIVLTLVLVSWVMFGKKG